jgi:hypothetical protein
MEITIRVIENPFTDYKNLHERFSAESSAKKYIELYKSFL